MRAEAGLEPVGHKWTDEQTNQLWSYVEDLQEELYHGKGNFTRPQVLQKITNLFSKCQVNLSSSI